MIKKITATTLLIAGLTTSAFAFEQQGVKQGNSRVGVNAMYMSVTPEGADESTDMGLITGSYAKFLTDGLELGAGLTYIVSEGEEDLEAVYTLRPFIKYNFTNMSPTTVPYIGASMSYMDGDIMEESEMGFGGEAGIKMFVSETTSITTALFYETYDTVDIVGLQVGVEFYFD